MMLRMGTSFPSAEWTGISDELQLALSRHAMRNAAQIVADQAELFAVQFTARSLQDRGAADALKLFAVLLRETSADCLRPMGNA
jgi:hypothetical protein